MYKISILIPVYNVKQEYLEKCIYSVKSQTYKNIEAIIIDDGSKDECASLCDELVKDDDRFRVVHIKNNGLSNARNTAVELCSGSWFLFLDGDDWLESTICEKLVKTIDDTIDVIIYGMFRDINENQSKIPMKYHKENAYVGQECIELRKKVLQHDSFISSSVGKLYNKKFIISNNLFHDSELRSGMEGIEFIYRVFSYINCVRTIDDYGYHYIYNNESLSAVPDENNNRLTMLALKKMSEFSKSKGYDDVKMIEDRTIYAIMAIGTRSFFNPIVKLKLRERARKFRSFLREYQLLELINCIEYRRFPRKKWVLIFLIKHQMFFILYVYSYMSYLKTKI